jgi:hypothetical protein
VGRWLWRPLILVALAAAVAGSVLGPAGASSDSQIEQGLRLFQDKCATCHGVNLEGGDGPSLVNGVAINDFGRDGVAMRRFIQRSMPRLDPGSLTAEEALNATQFILSRNGIGPDGFAEPAIRAVWEQADGPVAAGQSNRGWLWGPVDGWTQVRWEPYGEAPGARRLVQYFEKTRMEILDLNGDRNAPGFVTNGLLARELVAGRIQTGNSTDQPHRPTDTITVAGDPDDAAGPTYASFARVATLAPGQNPAPARVDQPVTAVIDRAGAVRQDESLAGQGVTTAHWDDRTQHNVPDVFLRYLTERNEQWWEVSGLPITEPYWAKVKVGGQVKDVLIQVFERRVLTYTPTNAEASRVEMGNVGAQYYRWRYES